jgi:glycosyltransferase involved in cell wall biosynthesis
MSGGRHLLAVNFRDPAHPEAGGAEQHLEEILVEAVRRGHRVTWLATGFPGGPAESEHRGIRVARRGAWWNFNWVVPRVLAREFSRPAPDLVIEDINKVPCLTPWWTRSPVAVIIPHLFGTAAFKEASIPVASYVLALESLIPHVYARSRFVVISESTRDDLARRGIPRARVSVVHCGMDHAVYRAPEGVAKRREPTVLFVGRLRRYKGVDWVLRAWPDVLARVPGARLEVVGDGPFRPALERMADRLGIRASVAFLGFIGSSEKVLRMSEAWALVQPSPKEGWGLTVVEAGACGTAVVAADSPGLRDSVRRDETGLLVPFGDDSALAEGLARVLTDAALRSRFEQAGRAWAGRFTWPECAARSLDALLGAAGERS